MIKNEFLRFMHTLTGENAPDGVCKIANLVLEHFEIVQPLGTHQGQRVKRIVRLAQTHWQTLATDINVELNETDEAAAPITRLKSLQVGPFRGFARQETIDLDSQLVLIYGPNGTGKTSFCEALEYGLLGNVVEAENKRFSQNDYLTNVHVGQFSPPVIEAIDIQGLPVPVTTNDAQYRFCFVEKNRIDNFSRIAAQLPARQTELISTLFGLDDFNEFVRKFTNEMDNYIDLLGMKNQQLLLKRKMLEGHEQTLETNNKALLGIEAKEIALANQYKADITFTDLVVALGTTETPGEIALLDNDLQQIPPSLTGLTNKALNDGQQQVDSVNDALNTKLADLVASSSDLSFKQLYTAVTALNEESKDNCPACKTPLDQVTRNPFELATLELEKLEHLTQLEQERDQLKENLFSAIKKIYKALKLATEQVCDEEQQNSLVIYLVEQDSQLTWDWWQSLHIDPGDTTTAWHELLRQVKILEERDVIVVKANDDRAQKQKRLSELRQLDRDVIALQHQRKTIEDGIQAAIDVIVNFDEKNKDLIAAVEAESAIVAVNREISESYSQFVTWLEYYRDVLPSRLIENLGDTVVELYNSFNRNDAEKDLLAGIKLPLEQGQKIQIAFQTNPGQYYDALHILSEGHIRCIGLAILLAKNLRENSPILIFDDPVNAIDDDHRESIRRTLFEDDFFDNKQIILTCHGEEFFKDIQNLLGAERAAQSQNLTFLPQLDEQHIRIDFNCAPRNYILAAQGHMARLEVREALAKSRQALESLTKGKVWPYVNRYGDGNLSIKMRSAGAPVELHNLTQQLKLKLSRDNFIHQHKAAVLLPIETLLGIGGDSREWRYLNKGTHDEIDRAEFDRATVEIIVNALAALDVAI